MAAPTANDLRPCSFFADFTDVALTELLPVVREEIYAPKQILYREGQPADKAFFLVQGEAEEEQRLPGDQEPVAGLSRNQSYYVRRYGPGQHFALQSLLSLPAAFGTIVANSDCRFITLSRAAFEEIQNKKTGLALTIMRGLCHAFSQDSTRAIGMEIKNSLLLGQMRIEKKKIQAMHRIANSTSLGSVKKTLETILDACMDCLAVEKGSVMIHDKGYLKVEAAFGPDQDEIIGKSQKITDASVSGRCFMSQKPILISDIENTAGLNRAGGGKKYANNSVLSLPLVSLQGLSIGVLNVSKTSEEIFSEKDLHILNDLAQEASATLGHEIYLAKIFKEFQDAYVDIRRGREQLESLEKRVCDCSGISWAEDRDERA